MEKSFFISEADVLAQNLLGKILCVRQNNITKKSRITQTECYFGSCDSASHAYKGKTARNAPMFEGGGTIYVYLCYGLHFMFNIVSGNAGEPQAVLVRGVQDAVGPGRLCKFFGIDKSFNGQSMISNPQIWLEDDGFKANFTTSKRIGIDYAQQKDRERPWRFILKQ